MPDRKELIERLGETNLFSGVDQGTLGRIADICVSRSYTSHQCIYEPGDDADHAYVLLSGSVRFTLETGITMLSSGSVMKSRMVFGWAALVPDQSQRIGSARCLEPSVVLAVKGDDLIDILRQAPESGFLVMHRLAGMIARNFIEQRKGTA